MEAEAWEISSLGRPPAAGQGVACVRARFLTRREEAEPGTEQDGKGGITMGSLMGPCNCKQQEGCGWSVCRPLFHYSLFIALPVGSTNRNELPCRGVTGCPVHPKSRMCLGLEGLCWPGTHRTVPV